MTNRDGSANSISLVPDKQPSADQQPTFAATTHYRFQESLQGYFAKLVDKVEDQAAVASARREMLVRHLENRYRRSGGSHCAECHAPVRDVMRVVSSDDAGVVRSYECLCRRCLEAERAYTRSVSLFVDAVVFETIGNSNPQIARPAREEKIAA